MSFLKIKDAFKSYGNYEVLKNINLDFNLDEIVFIIGESGTGKSTLLHCLSLLDSFNEGEIFINNELINSKNSQKFRYNFFSYIFQDKQLVDYYNGEENIKYYAKNNKDYNEIIEALEIKEIVNKNIDQLSSGEKQRIAIARALLNYPKIIVMDEPTGNLNEELSIKMMDLLKANSKGKLILIATHDIELAKKYATRILYLNNHCILEENISYPEEVVDRAENNIPYKKENLDTKVKKELKFLKRYHQYPLIILFLFGLIISVFMSIIGIDEGLKGFIDYELKNRLDSNYYEFSIVEEGIEITDSTVFIYLRKNNIEYKEYENLNYVFNYLIKQKFKVENDIDFNFEFSIIDFNFASSLNLDKKRNNLNVIINDLFEKKYPKDFLTFNQDINILSFKEQYNWTINIDGINKESTIFNNPKIYINYDYACELLNEQLINYLFKTQNEIKIPKLIISLTNINALNRLLDNNPNYYSYLNTQKTNGVIYSSPNLILSKSFKSIINSVYYIFILLIGILLFTLISLFSFILNYLFNYRKLEFALDYAFGKRNIDIETNFFLQSFLILFTGLLLSIGIYFLISYFLNQIPISFINSSYKYNICEFETKALISGVYITLIISLITFIFNKSDLNKFKFAEVFKNE